MTSEAASGPTLRRGAVPARIVDVAALAGVSPGTASKALNGTGQLRSETRERVRRAAEQLGFTPDGFGRGLSSGRSFTVGLLTTDSVGRFTIPVMLGAEDALGAGDMAVLLCDTRDDALRERHYLRTLVARRVDGIIVTGRRTDFRSPIDVPMPVVYALGSSEDPQDTSLAPDDAAGAEAVTTHLLDLGRRRIAHVSGTPQHRSAYERAESVVRAAGDALVGEPLFGSWSERWGRQAVDIVLRRYPDVDAISCGNDQIARGVCDRLRELGRRVPDDVAVTGYDDWDVMTLACRPPLTTVDMQLEELGRRAAELLLAAVGGEPMPPGRMLLPPRLVVRESTVGG